MGRGPGEGGEVLVGSLLRALTPVPDPDARSLPAVAGLLLARQKSASVRGRQQLPPGPGPGHGRLIAESTSPTWKEMVTEPGISKNSQDWCCRCMLLLPESTSPIDRGLFLTCTM